MTHLGPLLSLTGLQLRCWLVLGSHLRLRILFQGDVIWGRIHIFEAIGHTEA